MEAGSDFIAYAGSGSVFSVDAKSSPRDTIAALLITGNVLRNCVRAAYRCKNLSTLWFETPEPDASTDRERIAIGQKVPIAKILVPSNSSCFHPQY